MNKKETDEIRLDKQRIKRAIELLEKVLENGYLSELVLQDCEEALHSLEDTLE